MATISTSNHEKYVDGRKNPVVAALMDRLFAAVSARVSAFAPQSLLDAGCGEGHALEYVKGLQLTRYVGVDANLDCVTWCRERFPEHTFSRESVLALPFGNAEFDVVLCMEVLEHLEDPTAALRELARVARVGVVLTVPWEPVFQAGNLARGKYLPTIGNHPEHIQHWGRRSFPRWIASTGLLTDVSVQVAGTWLVAAGRPAR